MGFLKVAGCMAVLACVTYVFIHYVKVDLNDLHITSLIRDSLTAMTASNESKTKLFTKEELLQYKYKYLAIAGEIYDVSGPKGDRHYGVDGGYNFFTGIDGTRAFVSGDFTEKGLIDDIEGLGADGIRSIEDWKIMYGTDYKYVGRLIGNFYDANGEETKAKAKYNEMLKEAERLKKNDQEMKKLYPPCNAEFKNKASRVWCSNKSGGISRSWVGVPRKMFAPGGNTFRCACIKTTGPPSSDLTGKPHNNRGDLDNPNLRLYGDCEPTAVSCPI